MFATLQAKAIGALIVLLAIVGVWMWGDIHGGRAVQARWDAQQKADHAAEIAQVAKSELVSQMVVDHYIDRVNVVMAQSAVIVKKVPVYVTREADARCPVPAGFVRLHDAAVQGSGLPDAAAGTVDAPSGVALSAVARTVAGNYGICRETAERLSALQDWTRKQHEVH